MSEPHQEQKEIENRVRPMLDQYNYFIIGICIAGIGFSVSQTIGSSLSFCQIPLGLAILFWGLGIHYGLRAISFAISKEGLKFQYFEAIKKAVEISGGNPGLMVIAEENLVVYREGINLKLEAVVKKANSSIKWLYRFLIFGVLCFLFWHILQMYSNGMN